MEIPFTKLQGCGNDFILIDALRESLEPDAAQVSRLCTRRYGVGADGVLLLRPSRTADAFMDVRNADGSRALMCGNGIRCAALYLYGRSLCSEAPVIDTPSGAHALAVTPSGGPHSAVISVEMGRASTDCAAVPMLWDGPNGDIELEAAGVRLRATAVSTGNPHAVVFCERAVDDVDVASLGPALERHPLFPEGVNAIFANALPDGSLRLRVWERGVGETLSCGTGACAAAAAAVFTGRAACGRLAISTRGGELAVSVGDGMKLTLSGPASEVFSGIASV